MTYSFRSLPIGIVICEMTNCKVATSLTPLRPFYPYIYDLVESTKLIGYAGGCLNDWHDAIGEVDDLVEKQGSGER